MSMRVFQKVIDEGGFAAAARALDLSPAVVTRLVSDLEQHLQARLIQRTTRRLALTEAGEAYLQRLRPILGDIDDAEAVTLAHSTELRGTLRLQVTPVLAVHYLGPLLAECRRRCPQLRIDVHVDTLPDPPPVEAYDVTLFAADTGFDADVVARAVGTTQIVLCASPAYLQAHGAPATPDDLLRHECLKMRQQSPLRHWRLLPADGHGAPRELTIEPAIVANHTDTLLRAMLAGAGIGTLSLALAGAYFESGDLLPVLPDWITGEFTVYAALPTRKHVPARSRAFVDFLVEVTGKRALQAARAYAHAAPAAVKMDPPKPKPKQPAARATKGTPR